MPVPGIQEFRNQDYDDALPLLIQSAEAGDAEAQCLLGNIYQLGLGSIHVDDAQAIRWYHRSAKQGYSIATNNLGGMVWSMSSDAASALYQLAKRQALDSHAHDAAISA
ncbi:MAG: sel1 repeat family protein [Cyanobacteria bacterium P01_D01_bin.105]